MIFRIWVDDVRIPPTRYEYIWCKSTNDTIALLATMTDNEIIELNLDHDAGDYARFGGDYIRVLDWLESVGRSVPIHIHSMNPVGVQNMRAIIQKNHWREV